MTCTYSKDEIGKCLHFILLDCNEDGQADEECSEKRSTEDTNSKEVNSTARGASWWPCLRSDNPQKIIDICAQVGYLQDGTLELELADVAMDFFLNADYSTTDENVSLAVLLGGRTMPLPTNASRFILNMDGNLTSRPYKGSTSQLFQLGARCRTDVALREAIQDMRLFAPAYARPKHSNKRTAVASQDEDDSAKKRAKSSNDGTQKCPPSSALTENGPVPVAKPADTIPAPAGEASLPVKAATNEATIDKVNVAPTETPDVPSTAAAVSAVGVVRVDKSTTAAANASTNQPNVGAPSTSAQAALTAEASAPTDADKASTAQKALTNSPSSNDTGVAMNTEAAFADNSSVEKQLTSKVTDGVADESDIRGTAANTSGATNEINTPLTRASKQRQENQTGSAKNSTSAKVIKSRPSTTKAKTKKGTIARSTPKSVALKNNAPSTASSVDLIELEKPDFKTIKPLLEKVGYTFHWKKKQFCRPVRDGGQAFLSKENFRRDLCAYGVTCNCGNADIDHGCECWTDTEAYDIHRWVRYAVIGGTCQSTCVPLIQSNDAKLLLLELGFSEYHFVSKGWFSPGIALPGFNQENGVEGESFFHARKDLWNHLGRFGLPETCNFDEMSPEDRLKLEFHLSANYRDTFKLLDRNSPGRRYKNRHSSTTGHYLQSDSTVVSEPSPSVSVKSATQRRFNIKASTKRTASTRTAAIEAETPPLDSKSPHGDSLPPRVSVGVDPELAGEASLLPVFDGTALEKLEACLDALHPSYQLHRPTFTNDMNSKFLINMSKVKDFVGATLLAECCHGGDESKPAAIYCCGPPGIGKTSGISWCCNHAVVSWDDDEGPKPIICEMNASEKSWEATVWELGSALGMKSKITESRVSSKLRSGKHPLLFVVDEIDSLLSGNGNKAKGLSKLLEWANDTEVHFALIGISNSMNDEKAFAIQEAGEFAETVMFSAYSEAEIFRILEARIGHAVVDPRMLSFCAKKVAASSGDVRKALEMTSIAIRKSMQEIGDMDPTMVQELNSAERHLVGLKHLSQAFKGATADFQKRIEDLPLAGKMMICVTAILSQANVCETTIRELKSYVTDCLNMGGHDDEILKLEDFIPLLSTLVDQGLLRASTRSNLDDIFNSSRSIGDIGAEPIVIGTQQDDIMKAIERELKQPFFQQIRQAAEDNKKKLRKY